MFNRKLFHLLVLISVVSSLIFGQTGLVEAKKKPPAKPTAAPVVQAQKTPPPPTGNIHKGKITAADRKAAAERAAAARLSAKTQAQGLAVGGISPVSPAVMAMAAPNVTANALGMPDYFGTIPNWAQSPLPLTAAPTVSFTGGDGLAAATAVVDASGTVVGFAVTAPGSGYVAGPVTITAAAGGTGSGAAGTAVVLGSITAINVGVGGTGYSATPVVTITGDGTGASAAAVVDVNGVITGFTNITGGTNYTTATVTITDTTGTGATATAVITGGVASITLTAPGSGYFAVDPVTNGLMGGIRKFMDFVPGLGVAGQNNLQQHIAVAVPDTAKYANLNCDYYEIELVEYTEQLHTDLPPTKLRGYRQTNGPDTSPSYLGPVIVATKDKPVCIKFTNSLPPTSGGGDLFIPVDTTVMGAGMGPNGGMYTQNRATLHLHGGDTPWISDGTPHQWTTPASENAQYPEGVSVYNVPAMDAPGPGSLTFFYSNRQSARLMFYHDHSYGITRLNVYAGEAAGYLIRDDAEAALIADGIIPGKNAGEEIPLILQDKTFVPDTTQLVAQDPTWDTANWGGKGNLWFPHVYMPNQNPADMSGANMMGRWDYGPWFWPPFTGMVNGAVPNPLAGTSATEGPDNPGTPNPSLVPEAFMDTPLVNGTAYPVLKVGPKAYRFRILNASNDRMLNLSLFYAKSNAPMWNANGSLADANAGEVNMVQAVPNAGLPASWPTDGRDGGVPDPAAAGPSWIQIGTEGGFLPAPAVIPPTPIGYNYNRRDIVVLNVSNHSLFLGPAERADVIVDFSGIPDGSRLILYNDGPAPVPAFDPRNDYYTGDPDQTSTGGAPSTQPGYGPNTRTWMQIQIDATLGSASTFSLANLQTRLPAAYAQFQPKPLVPQANYNTAFGQSGPVDAYARISSTSMSFFNGPLTKLTLTAAGTGFTSVPTVSITGGGGSGATASATLAPAAVGSLFRSTAGSGYTSVPSVVITGGGGTGATATAVLNTRSVASFSVTAAGSKYTTVPTVTLTGGGGIGAAGTAVISGGKVTGITLTTPGSGYTSAPTVAITGGGGSGAKATANLTTTSVASLTLNNGGSGYTSNPTLTITGGGGTGATGLAFLAPRVVGSLTLVNPGAAFTSAPTVTISGGGGTGAKATAAGVTMQLQPKAIQELFEADYGRMNAILGVELPMTTMTTQTTIPYGYIDPPTEIVTPSDPLTPVGSAGDGTQIWKITHNGVDTHAIHFHMWNVQVINRVGWDGAIRPPESNEIGWKDTVRMNPLEDIIVALRPILPTNLPFDLPNSIRPMDVTMPLGSTSATAYTNVDPAGQPANVINAKVNFGYEYVWHCHLLGHEENDMMRPVIIAAPPKAPVNLVASVPNNTHVNLSFIDQSLNETGFTVQRAYALAGPWTNVATVPGAVNAGSTVTATITVARRTTYYLRVVANNVVGYTQAYAAPAVGYPHQSVDSVPTDPVTAVTH